MNRLDATAAFTRAYSDTVRSTEPMPERLPVGPLSLRSGREVFNTGRVLIGKRAGESRNVVAPRVFDWNKPVPQISADAERIQGLLIDDASRDWFGNPVWLVIGAIVLVGTVWYSVTHPWGWW
jgi:hypothetical protein